MKTRVLITILLPILILSQEIVQNKSIPTSFGQLSIVNNTDSGGLSIFYNGNKISHPFSYGYPEFIGKLTRNVIPYDVIIILQDVMAGTACGGLGNVYFLGMSKNKNPIFLNDSIENCFISPIIDTLNNTIILTQLDIIKDSIGYIPEEIYKYSNDKIARIDSNPPLVISFRSSSFSTSYVAQIKNYSEIDSLNLWFSSINKKVNFISAPNSLTEFGWMEGFSIGANNSIQIGGEHYATIKCSPSSKELANIKFILSGDGIGISLSQEYLQSIANKVFKPQNKEVATFFTASMNSAPLITFSENSDRINVNGTINLSFIVDGLGFDINVSASGAPYFNSNFKEVLLNEIRIDSVNLDLIKKERRSHISEVATEFLQAFFVSFKLPLPLNGNGWKTKLLKGIVNKIVIKNGRLVIFIL